MEDQFYRTDIILFLLYLIDHYYIVYFVCFCIPIQLIIGLIHLVVLLDLWLRGFYEHSSAKVFYSNWRFFTLSIVYSLSIIILKKMILFRRMGKKLNPCAKYYFPIKNHMPASIFTMDAYYKHSSTK